MSDEEKKNEGLEKAMEQIYANVMGPEQCIESVSMTIGQIANQINVKGLRHMSVLIEGWLNAGVWATTEREFIESFLKYVNTKRVERETYIASN